MTLEEEFKKLGTICEAFRDQFNVVCTQAHAEMQEDPDIPVDERLALNEMIDAVAEFNQAMNMLIPVLREI